MVGGHLPVSAQSAIPVCCVPTFGRACQASKGKQKGADGKFVQYMDGPMYALSFEVAKSIVFDDSAHSALYQL